jgi:divalent metal cation (Fe/Co/Zn/Cd) transporter
VDLSGARQTVAMPSDPSIVSDDLSARERLLERALILSYVSVLWGAGSGAWSLTAGLLAGSLGVFGLGLSVVGDVVGSTFLVWRFRAERGDPNRADRAEAKVSLVVAGSLTVAAVVLALEATYALATGSGPERSWSAMVSAGAAAAVLAPLGRAKYRVATALQSHALRGDATLSGIGAVLGVLALLGLLTDRLLGWWWADRVAALAVAAIASAEAARVVRKRPRPSA